jgi:hypothetical protein
MEEGLLMVNGGYIGNDNHSKDINHKVKPLLPTGYEGNKEEVSNLSANTSKISPLLPTGFGMIKTKNQSDEK